MQRRYWRLILLAVACSLATLPLAPTPVAAETDIIFTGTFIDWNKPISVELIGFSDYEIVDVAWSCEYTGSACLYDCPRTWTAHSTGLTTGEITFERCGNYKVIAFITYMNPNGWGGPENDFTDVSRDVFVMPWTILLIIGVCVISALIILYIVIRAVSEKGKEKPHRASKEERRDILARTSNIEGARKLGETAREKPRAELEGVEAIDTTQPALVPIKKSAAAKRAATGTAGSVGATTAPTKVARPAPSSGAQPKDKSGYSQNAVETGTPVNRTVLKDYIERQRKEGARELHFIKIKNDLNIISQKKSGKLYRILQELVKDEILVRKGSNYVIVG
jgi:hypothetical protein